MSAWDGSVRRVLIVRTGAIGDVVNAMSLAAALKAADPAPEITWMVHDLSAPLLTDNALVDRVVRVPRRDGLRGYWRAARAVRALGLDLAIDLQRIAKSALLARASGARRVLGWDRGRAKEGAWLFVKERVARTDPRKHMVEQYADFARYLGLAPKAPFGWLPRNAAAAARWDAADWCGPAIAVNVGASTDPKRWLPERFGAVAAALEARGYQVLLTGNGAQDRAAAAVALESAQANGAQRVQSLIDQTTLAELTELLARTRLFIGCDTGPMHMAVAMECPVLALFGLGTARRTGPYQPSATRRVLYAGAADTPAPMAELTVERVVAAAFEVLAASETT